MKKACIVPFKNAPSWRKHNNHILTGYRKNHNTIKKILKSLKTKHNQLMNIWTHLLPTIFLTIYLIFFTINTFFFSKDQISFSFTIPLIIAYISSIFCFGSSSMYHLFACLSCKTCNSMVVYDFLGIMGLTYFQFTVSFYYVFYYSYFFMGLYFFINTLGMFVLLFVILSPKYQIEKYDLLRIFCFIGIIGCNLIPFFHAFFNSYYADEDKGVIDYFEALSYFGLQFVCYGIGIIFYLSKYPEKAFPKKFDIWMNSHTVWHIFVFIGILMQTIASNLFYNQRKSLILSNLNSILN